MVLLCGVHGCLSSALGTCCAQDDVKTGKAFPGVSVLNKTHVAPRMICNPLGHSQRSRSSMGAMLPPEWKKHEKALTSASVLKGPMLRPYWFENRQSFHKCLGQQWGPCCGQNEMKNAMAFTSAPALPKPRLCPERIEIHESFHKDLSCRHLAGCMPVCCG